MFLKYEQSIKPLKFLLEEAVFGQLRKWKSPSPWIPTESKAPWSNLGSRGTAALQEQWQAWVRVFSCSPSLSTRILVPTLAQKSSCPPHLYFDLDSFFHCTALKKPSAIIGIYKPPNPSVKVGALRSWWPLVGWEQWKWLGLTSPWPGWVLLILVWLNLMGLTESG